MSAIVAFEDFQVEGDNRQRLVNQGLLLNFNKAISNNALLKNSPQKARKPPQHDASGGLFRAFRGFLFFSTDRIFAE